MILIRWSVHQSFGTYNVFGKLFDSEESESADIFMDELFDKGIEQFERLDFFDIDNDSILRKDHKDVS